MYTSSNFIRVIKSKRMRWEGHVAHMGEIRIYTKFWLEILKGRDNLEELGTDVRIILKWILEK
jgi:hypothetical protein